MTTGLDAGPYGDPMRFPPMTKWRDPVQGVTYDSYMHGTFLTLMNSSRMQCDPSTVPFHTGLGFQRPISLWRTTYSSITQARSNLPDVIGAVTWIGKNAAIPQRNAMLLRTVMIISCISNSSSAIRPSS
jgi:dipeptidase